MAQEKTDRRTPEQKDYRARPSVSGAKSPQTADKKKTLQSELDDLNFDFEAVGDERNPETEDTKLSLKLMIDELTDKQYIQKTRTAFGAFFVAFFIDRLCLFMI